MKILFGVLTLTLTLINPVQAHLYKTYVWEATDKNVVGPQYIVEYSDHHVAKEAKNKSQNNPQRKHIVKQAQELDALVIAEDMFVPGQKVLEKDPLGYDPNGDQRPYYSQKKCNDIPGDYCAIFDLQLQCQYDGVPTVNVECRQARTASMANEIKVPSDIALKATDVAIANAKKFNDSPQHKEVYDSWLWELEKEILPACEPLLEQLCDADYTVQELLPKVRYNNELDAEFNFNPKLPSEQKKYDAVSLYDRTLIDINIIHEIAQAKAKNKNVAIVCAGGGHIERVNEVLPKLGYKKQLEFPKKKHPYNVEPTALDLNKTYAQVKNAMHTNHPVAQAAITDTTVETKKSAPIQSEPSDSFAHKHQMELFLLAAFVIIVTLGGYLRNKKK